MRTFCLAAVLLGSAAVLGVESGLQKGDAVPVFEPLHVAGPLKGNSCPTWMFGASTVIQVWIIQDGAANPAGLATNLEKFLAANPAFKGSVIFTDESKRPDLVKMAAAEKIEKADLAVLPAANKDSTMKAFKLSAQAKNTIHVYKDKKVAATFVDVGDADFAKVIEAAKAL